MTDLVYLIFDNCLLSECHNIRNNFIVPLSVIVLQVQGAVFDEFPSEEKMSVPSPKKPSSASQADIEKHLVAWARELLKE